MTSNFLHSAKIPHEWINRKYPVNFLLDCSTIGNYFSSYVQLLFHHPPRDISRFSSLKNIVRVQRDATDYRLYIKFNNFYSCKNYIHENYDSPLSHLSLLGNFIHSPRNDRSFFTNNLIVKKNSHLFSHYHLSLFLGNIIPKEVVDFGDFFKLYLTRDQSLLLLFQRDYSYCDVYREYYPLFKNYYQLRSTNQLIINMGHFHTRDVLNVLRNRTLLYHQYFVSGQDLIVSMKNRESYFSLLFNPFYCCDKLLQVRPYYKACTSPIDYVHQSNVYKCNTDNIQDYPIRLQEQINSDKIQLIKSDNDILLRSTQGNNDSINYINNSTSNDKILSVDYYVSVSSTNYNDPQKCITKSFEEYKLLKSLNADDCKILQIDSIFLKNVSANGECKLLRIFHEDKFKYNFTKTLIYELKKNNVIENIDQSSDQFIISNGIYSNNIVYISIARDQYSNISGQPILDSFDYTSMSTFKNKFLLQFKCENDAVDFLTSAWQTILSHTPIYRRCDYLSRNNKKLSPHVLRVYNFSGNKKQLQQFLQPLLNNIVISDVPDKDYFIISTQSIDDCEKILSLNHENYDFKKVVIIRHYEEYIQESDNKFTFINVSEDALDELKLLIPGKNINTIFDEASSSYLSVVDIQDISYLGALLSWRAHKCNEKKISKKFSFLSRPYYKSAIPQFMHARERTTQSRSLQSRT